MIAKVQKWGNSQGLRLSKEMLAGVDIDVGDEVEITARDGSLLIEPLRRVRGRLDLSVLLKGMPKNYKAEEFNWGGPAGKEVW